MDDFKWVCCDCEKKFYTDEEPQKCDNCGCIDFIPKWFYNAAHGIDDSPQPKSPNIPKCPTCGSTDVHKISTGSKVFGFAMVGVFSSNLGKTMHCKNCGYKW